MLSPGYRKRQFDFDALIPLQHPNLKTVLLHSFHGSETLWPFTVRGFRHNLWKVLLLY